MYNHIMHILVLYGTNSGGTQVSSEILTRQLIAMGHDVDLKRVSSVEPVELKNYDILVMGSCTWNYDKLEGQLQEEFRDFKEKMGQLSLNNQRCAVFGLGDLSYTDFAGAADRLKELVTEHNGVLIGQPLKIDGFFYKEEENTQALKTWIHQIFDSLSK
jgi:flavodoxin I